MTETAQDRAGSVTELPGALAINAWPGEPAAGAVAADGARWGARRGLPHGQDALPVPAPADPADWAHPDVGYGVLLPDRDEPGLDDAAKAAARDAPEPVRRLLAARPGSVVLRWRSDLDGRFVRRHYPDAPHQDPVIGLSSFGVGRGRLPRYLLIVGGPDEVPWSVQYALNTRHAVGRLPLSGDALGNYVEALLAGWPAADLDPAGPLLWSVVHDPGDITALMRTVVTDRLAAVLTDPRLPGTRHLTDADATGGNLLAGLGRRPALVVTSSHGRTAPLDDPAALAAGLGLPVDRTRAAVPLAELAAAMPAGAIWYAQACCSAGGDAASQFAALLEPGSAAHRVVAAVAALGATVAPAATALLGRPDPVRAVLGHVEPTFDWTLRVPETGQALGGDLVAALSSNLFHGQPVGLAFAAYRAGVGELHSQWARAREGLRAEDTATRHRLTRLRLTALDRQSLVLLGDPTVRLPTPL